MFAYPKTRNHILLSIVAIMTETGIFDLKNIIIIAVKMHSVRHPGALGHVPDDMGILVDISFNSPHSARCPSI
jgi:hypothetical protein